MLLLSQLESDLTICVTTWLCVQKSMVQRPLNYALVDGRLNLDWRSAYSIVSGRAASDWVSSITWRAYVQTLIRDDYIIDVPSKTISCLILSIDKAENYFNLENLYDNENVAFDCLSTMPFVQTTSWFWISTMWSLAKIRNVIVDQYWTDHGRTSLFW